MNVLLQLEAFGRTMLFISSTGATDEIISVPGARTLLPSGYFCVILIESLPVGILMPRATAKSETAFTAPYRRASSPLFLLGHIQLALSETAFMPPLSGAHTTFVRASATESLLPAPESIRAAAGAWPIEVAMPSLLS